MRGRGFTLIELLLVITIVSLLATIVLVGVNSGRSKARDAKRLTDIKTIASALEFFYSDKGHYPVAVGWITGCSLSGANWISDNGDYSWNSKYIEAMPRDPSESCGGTNERYYAYKSDGDIYQLTAKLENPLPPAITGQTFAYNGSFFEPVTDTTPISISFSSPVSNPTNQSPIPLSISFSRAVVDFSQGSLSVVSGVISGFSAVFESLYNVFITPTDNNTVVVSVVGGVVHDENGVGNTAAQFTITYDSLLPHVALSPDPLPGTVDGSFSVSVNFTVAVVDFSASIISVTNATVTSFTQINASNYTFTVTPATPGTVTVSIPGGVAHSAAGNGNIVSNAISTTYSGE